MWESWFYPLLILNPLTVSMEKEDKPGSGRNWIYSNLEHSEKPNLFYWEKNEEKWNKELGFHLLRYVGGNWTNKWIGKVFGF